MYLEPAKAFARLDDQCWFLCSLFSSQLVDQGCHAVTGTVRKPRAGTIGEIRLSGLLSSFWNTMHPGYLLLVLGLYELPLSDELVADGIRDTLTTELNHLRATPEERERILTELRSAMSPDAIPHSLRSFVPHGDKYRWQTNPATVEQLRSAAASALEKVPG